MSDDKSFKPHEGDREDKQEETASLVGAELTSSSCRFILTE